MKNNNTTTRTTRKDFEEVKRSFERAYAMGDYAAELMELAEAVAHSVIAKCIDPQRKDATKRERISDSGFNPALVAVKRSIRKDLELLRETRENNNRATEYRTRYNADGDCITGEEVVDDAAAEAVKQMITRALGDGLDLVQEAALALCEEAAAHAVTGENWLDAPYSVRRLSKRVLIREEDSAAYVEEETRAIVEVYRAVRRAVANSRAMQTDPRNGYCYLEEVYADEDGEESVCYRRLPKHADLGGHVSSSFTGEDFGGAYTVSECALFEYNAALSRLNLTERQAVIVRYRMQGLGKRAIASRLGISAGNVDTVLVRLRKRCEEMGFAPVK